MKYEKPTIEVLGDAASVIQSTKAGNPFDNGGQALTPNSPAYELDE